MAMTAQNSVAVALNHIINKAGMTNFPKKQGSWNRFEQACESLTKCGWKMGMCKSASGKDNAINRMYTTGVIRSYPSTLIQCLFIDDYIEEISRVYRAEFGTKMRCSPILVLVNEDDENLWRINRVLVQDQHPMLPLNQSEITELFPNAEIQCIETIGLIPTKGWASDTRSTEKCVEHEWGDIVSFGTRTNSDGVYTELRQSCRNQSCEEIRKGVIQGHIEWEMIPW